MERKEYFRYTKLPSKKEVKAAKTIDVHTVSGPASFIKKQFGYWSMRINGNWVRFKLDETCKAASKYLDSRDKVTVRFYCEGEYWSRLISFENHKKNVLVTNKRIQRIVSYQEEIRAKEAEKQAKVDKARRMAYDILFPVLDNSAVTLMILEKKEKGYKLINLAGIDQYWTTCKVVNRFLRDNGFKEILHDDRILHSGAKSEFFDIPDSNCELFVCFHTWKKKNCKCGANKDDNYSLMIHEGYGFYEYHCAYCFFEEMNIIVPKKFINNYNPDEHILYIESDEKVFALC